MRKITLSFPEELIAEAEAAVAAGRAPSISAYLAAAASGIPDPAMESARYAVRLLIDKRTTRFTRRELHRHVHHRLPTAADVASVIDTLIQLGWIRCPTGGYELHPDADRLSHLAGAG